MYHRYMPTENGQYRRKAVSEPPRQEGQPETAKKPISSPEMPPPYRKEPPKREHPGAEEYIPQTRFPLLERLFPQKDSGDLLVTLLLLFLLSEGNEESGDMIMALAIFLFMQ